MGASGGLAARGSSAKGRSLGQYDEPRPMFSDLLPPSPPAEKASACKPLCVINVYCRDRCSLCFIWATSSANARTSVEA